MTAENSPKEHVATAMPNKFRAQLKSVKLLLQREQAAARPALRAWAVHPLLNAANGSNDVSPLSKLLDKFRQVVQASDQASDQPPGQPSQPPSQPQRHVYTPAQLRSLRHTRQHAFPANDPIALATATKPDTELSLLPFTPSTTRTSDVLLSDKNTLLTFADFHLSPYLQSALKKLGLTRPSPIQLQAIPRARLGVDVIAHAKSGTGKTIAFALVALDAYLSSGCSQASASPTTLVLVPTRELATQVTKVFCTLSSCIRPAVRVSTLMGGMPQRLDERALAERPPHVVVGTPGRVAALAENAALCLDTVAVLILDEADRLLEPAFQKDVKTICDVLPTARQSMAFSATFPPWLRRMLAELMRSPMYIRCAGNDGQEEGEVVDGSVHEADDVEAVQKALLLGVRQSKVAVGVIAKAGPSSSQLQRKMATLTRVLGKAFNFCIVFTNSKKDAGIITAHVQQAGFTSRCINAAMRQSERVGVMKCVREGSVRVLIATDLLARGVDVETCDLVIHLDVPGDVATYLHRVGRAGRFGGQGRSVIVYDAADEVNFVSSIERKIGFALHVEHVLDESNVCDEIVDRGVGEKRKLDLEDGRTGRKRIRQNGVIMMKKQMASSDDANNMLDASLKQKAGNEECTPALGENIVKRHALATEERTEVQPRATNADGESHVGKPKNSVGSYADEAFEEGDTTRSELEELMPRQSTPPFKEVIENARMNVTSLKRNEHPTSFAGDSESAWTDYAAQARQEGYEYAYQSAFRMAFELHKRLFDDMPQLK